MEGVTIFDMPAALTCPACGQRKDYSVRSLAREPEAHCPCGGSIQLREESGEMISGLRDLLDVMNDLEQMMAKVVEISRDSELGPCTLCNSVVEKALVSQEQLRGFCKTCPTRGTMN